MFEVFGEGKIVCFGGGVFLCCILFVSTGRVDKNFIIEEGDRGFVRVWSERRFKG